MNSRFEFAEVIRTAIATNIGKVLSFITEGENVDILLKEITNTQALEIVEIVYDSNYGLLEKKAKSLIEKIRKVFPSQTSSQQSFEHILNTDLKTSSENTTQKED